MNNIFAYTFKEAFLTTTGGSDLEYNKYVGRVSTIMGLITSEDGDLLYWFDKINENDINNTSLKEILTNNHELDANKRKIKGQIPLEHIFSVCKTYKKILQKT